MRKVTLLLLLTLFFFSCRKNWVCVCSIYKTTNYSDPGIPGESRSSTILTVIKKTRKANARPNCLSSVITSTGSVYIGSSEVTYYKKTESECTLE